MATKIDAPRRKHNVELYMQADDINSIIRELEYIAYRFLEARQVTDIVSGGYNVGFTLIHTVDEEMDHDKYVTALEEYLKAIRNDGD